MTSTHKDLIVWQQSMDIAVDIYSITRDFPKSEEFGLVSQMRRAVVSIPSNIAEGYGRGSRKELQHFLEISVGSASELETQVLISKRIGYMDTDMANDFCERLKQISLIQRCKENVVYRQK